MALIHLDAGAEQIRLNRKLLNAGAIVSTISGLIVWSATPFVTEIKALRYLSLAFSLGAGSTALYCGTKLAQSKTLFQAIERAEEDDFLHRVAASQYARQNAWNYLAESEAQPLPDPLTEPLPDTSAPVEAEASEVRGSEGFRDFPSTSATSNELAAEVVVEVLEAVGEGKSDTWIIENVLNMKGRKYKQGKELLAAIKVFTEDEDNIHG